MAGNGKDRTDKGYVMVIVGATGAVGNEILKVLDERKFPLKELRLIASERSQGSTISFQEKEHVVQKLSLPVFEKANIAFFTAGSPISLEYIPWALQSGCTVVDDSSAFRMDPQVPLVVPEVNGHLLSKTYPQKIFPVANCATIQLVVALAPLHKAANIRRIVMSTYQSTSGAGRLAMEELSKQMSDLFNYREMEIKVFPHRIAFNVIPQIDKFKEDGSTVEEDKIAKETRKVLGDDSIGISTTSVRVPTFHGHAESVNVEFEKPLSAKEAREILRDAPGIELMDDEKGRRYPVLLDAVGKNDVYVGRIRDDASRANCLNLWIVGDNLRKGAGLNAVQILENLHSQGLL